MSQPYVGLIIMFGGNFAPAGWMTASGQLLPISEYETLFNLIGTTYGGDGQSTFALPNLQSRVPVHMGQGAGLSNYSLGQTGGVENVTLTTQQIPQHNHYIQVQTSPGNQSVPASNCILATENSNAPGSGNAFTYVPYTGTNQVTMPNNSVSFTGSSQPHNNIQPVTALTYCISLFGVYPSPT